MTRRRPVDVLAALNDEYARLTSLGHRELSNVLGVIAQAAVLDGRDMRNRRHGLAMISVNDIAAATGMTKRTIRRQIVTLIDLGALYVWEEQHGGLGRSRTYLVTCLATREGISDAWVRTYVRDMNRRETRTGTERQGSPMTGVKTGDIDCPCPAVGNGVEIDSVVHSTPGNPCPLTETGDVPLYGVSPVARERKPTGPAA